MDFNSGRGCMEVNGYWRREGMCCKCSPFVDGGFVALWNGYRIRGFASIKRGCRPFFFSIVFASMAFCKGKSRGE